MLYYSNTLPVIGIGFVNNFSNHHINLRYKRNSRPTIYQLNRCIYGDIGMRIGGSDRSIDWLERRVKRGGGLTVPQYEYIIISYYI